ncbi:MAG TPA: ATP-binding protein [Syntrophales bacterium]|jgi:heavy metal sensor kinase|nr:ATP-binding protein [Syntrophales bacterium]HRT62968.1 ATP-binding protein [Syntrophales bacterium]
MFSREVFKIRRTLVFRLTFWYAIVFTVSSLLAFTLFYLIISKVIKDHTDQEMMKELAEAAAILKAKGENSFRNDMNFEAESEGVGNIFFRLLDPAGREITATNMTSWKGVDASRDALERVMGGESHVFETLSVSGQTCNARIVYGPAGPGRILQIGFSLEDDTRFLEAFRNVFVPSILIIMAFSTLIGWFMAARALSGVKDVTKTALDISEGAFDKRVQVQTGGDEIEQLAFAFNRMLDRIHELVRSLREVTDDIAHDLRTPIARIRGLAESELNAGKSGDETNKLAADTLEECDNLLLMINTMLEISEIEGGIRWISKTDVDLTRLVGDALELFRPIADGKGVRLVAGGSDRVSIRGNTHGLQRIIVNLLDNAIKYTPAGGTVSVSLREDKDHVDLVVQDTGIGISAEDLPLIFNRLYRCDSSRSQPGFGLGLSLASAVARAHGGHISAASRPGKGSSFTVTLPR